MALLVGLAFSALYAATARGFFLYGDDVLMFQVTEAIVERGEVSVTSPARKGRARDAALAPSASARAHHVARSIRSRDGGRFAKYGIGQSLAAIPFYAASRPLFDRLELPETRDPYGNLRTGAAIFGTGLANAVIGGATVAILFLLLVELGFSTFAAFVTSLALGLGTLWAHYSSTFLSEPLAGLCLVVAVFGLATYEKEARTRGDSRGRPGWLAMSGFACGLAVATKVALAAIVWPFALWAWWLGWRNSRWRYAFVTTLYWSSSFSVWVGIVATYNWARFGSVFESGYGREAGKFSTPLVEGFGGLLFSPVKGALWYCPVLLLSIAGALAFWRRNRSLSLAIGVASVSHLVLMAKYYQWYGGDCWGPRFLVPLLPLWLLPAAEVLSRWRRLRFAAKAAIATVIAASLATTLAGVLVPFDSFGERVTSSRAEMGRAAWSFRESPLAQHLALVPSSAAMTAKKLLGREGIITESGEFPGLKVPDFAFVRYGSHALLNWTRGALLLCALALASAAAILARAQKASVSRPPQ